MESADAPELVPESSVAIEIVDNPKEFVQEVQVDNVDPSTLWPDYCNPTYVMPAEIEVKVSVGAETYFFPLGIEKAVGPKKYLGGFRNKITGQVYHHASSQTPTDQKKVTKDYSNLRTRETQTSETRTLSVQPNRESGTQMERIDLRIDNKRDREMTARTYFTADELLLKKKVNLIEIQRCWRGYMARSRAKQIRQRNVDFARIMEENREKEVAAEREQRMRDMARRTHPKSNADFAVLYNELDTWRKTEVQKIKSSISDADERRQAMSELLSNETKALQGLQKLKHAAQREMQVEKTQQMLERMAMPHVWQLSKGDAAQVHTQETQRAKELLDLFNALNAPLLGTDTTDQRLDVLLNVKWTVKEMDSPLTREIMDLVDREADLLNRGRAPKSMESLRTRLSNLFLRFLENPQFNPRAADFVVEK
mmetsp:Transcript_22967/g.38300  ORF Transcript_22967/g.38300 Transcript_22967/m.38300 type:complete len:425 (-) Transcript_22967:2216-3490(-)|eukprot:CAMPEP_0174984726 /NCGR_PEP_ID=MMETSP0004_2-20121128/17901_1 /TAXON_ID=420556 /ORGANISM="Ochromonas sp., Strain CCMP1393" /LENGTH=424 /DNA_ID=CAMNT_0016237205 /DNA_START=17 /DNA_END=1291 /DNA_ORIENTATION=+